MNLYDFSSLILNHLKPSCSPLCLLVGNHWVRVLRKLKESNSALSIFSFLHSRAANILYKTSAHIPQSKRECCLNINNPKHLLVLQPQCARHYCNMLLFQLDAFYLQYMWWYSFYCIAECIFTFLNIFYTIYFPFIFFSSFNIKLNIKRHSLL